MDMGLVMMAMALQAGKLQTEVATTMLKSNLDAQKSTVQTLLGIGGQSTASLANVGAGIGGNLNVTA